MLDIDDITIQKKKLKIFPKISIALSITQKIILAKYKKTIKLPQLNKHHEGKHVILARELMKTDLSILSFSNENGICLVGTDVSFSIITTDTIHRGVM